MRAWIKNPNHFFCAAVVIAIGLMSTHMALNLTLADDLFLKTALNDLILTAATGLATAALFFAAHRSASLERRIRTGWMLLALAYLAYAFGNLTRFVLETILNEPPTASFVDVFYLLVYPLFAIGIVLLSEDSCTRGEQLKIALDTGIVIMAVGLVFWIWVFAPIITATRQVDFSALILVLAYPILDLSLFFVMLRFFFGRFSSSFPMPLFLLLSSGVFQIATHTLVSIQSAQANYQSGSWVDTGYVIAGILIGFAGITHASKVKSEHTALVRDDAPRYGEFTWRFYLPFLGVIAAYGMVIWNTDHSLPIPPQVLDWTAGSIIGLLLLRQAITIIENRQLYSAAQREIAERTRAEESLRQLNEQLEARVEERTVEFTRANLNLRSEITERTRAEDRQRVVYQVLSVVSAQLDSTAIAHMAVETIVKLTNCPHVCLALPSSDGQHWVVRGAGGSLAAELGAIYSIHQGVIGRVFKTGQSQWIHDVLDDPSYVRDVNRTDAPALRSEVAASIRRGEHLLGVLNIESDRVDAFLEEDVLMIQSLGDVIALALENARLFEEAQQEIAERKHAEEALRASEDRWRSLVGHAPATITTVDRAGTILSLNRTASGQPAEPFIEKSLFDYLPPTERVKTREVLDLVFHFGQPTQYETTITLAGDKTLWFSNHIAPIKRGNQVEAVIIVAIDITERKKMEEQLRHLSTHDALTGLYNRAFFEGELNRLRTSRQFPISIVVVDVDGMKIANDTQGHAAGDDLLRRTTGVLRAVFRAEDIIARIGGDEFAVLLPQTNGRIIGETLTRCHQELVRHNAEHTPSLSLSFGTATAATGSTLEGALKLADARMYQDKATHRGRTSNHDVI